MGSEMCIRDSLWMSSDAILLERILLNLVSNAFRATPQGGSVLLGCRRRGDMVRIDVCDTGPGIPEDMQSELFKEFFRHSPSPEVSSDSLGLGLTIVDGLAQLLDHPIELSSNLRRGTRFSICVPTVAAKLETPAETAPSVTFEPMAGRRVLVIDDDAMVRDSMAGILNGWGCNVTLVEGVDSAVAAAERHVPDLVISDYRLATEQTGLDAIAAVHNISGYAVPAFLVTAETNEKRLRDAAGSGYPILHKPVSPMALRAMTSQLLAGV